MDSRYDNFALNGRVEDTCSGYCPNVKAKHLYSPFQ